MPDIAKKIHFLEENRLVEVELIKWALFAYLLNEEDNVKLYFLLEKPVQGVLYTGLIKLF